MELKSPCCDAPIETDEVIEECRWITKTFCVACGREAESPVVQIADIEKIFKLPPESCNGIKRNND